METNWYPLAWLAPALILLMAIAANADMAESWRLGGPGGRDVRERRGLPWDDRALRTVRRDVPQR